MRTGHQAFLEGKHGVVRWVAGDGVGGSAGEECPLSCVEMTDCSHQLSREGLGVGPGLCSHSLTIKISASETGR